MRIWAVARSTAVGLAAVALPAQAAPASSDTSPASESQQEQTAADPVEQQADVPSDEAMRTMTWVAASGDNFGLPYIIIDKVAAEVFVFDPGGQLVAAAPALVGMKVGDESSPGVGDRELSAIPPDDRATPAGRFVAKFGRAAGGRDVLWVDYSTAISLHAVITSIKAQHRAERLKSPTPDDNRITYGCINVPAEFYKEVVKPLFKSKGGVVYILPETKPLSEVFPAMPQPQAAPSVGQPASVSSFE
jgi:hypothetical protein